MTKTISKNGSADAIWIELSAAPHKKIDWKEAIDSAEKAQSRGQKIFWEFHLGLSEPFFPIDDEMRLQELFCPLQYFSDTVYPHFETASLGVGLYRGPLDLKDRFFWSEKQKKNFAGWKEERGQESENHFCLDTYAAYFQLLAQKVPDSLPIFALFDGTGLSRVEALSLLSKERFHHFHLAVKGVGALSWCLEWKEECLVSFEPPIGVIFPLDCDPEEFEELLRSMDHLAGPYRVVNEAFITEEWDGLETIVSPVLSPRGKRMLKGFLASGGKVVDAEEFRGRGIRTPDLLVPNQPR